MPVTSRWGGTQSVIHDVLKGMVNSPSKAIREFLVPIVNMSARVALLLVANVTQTSNYGVLEEALKLFFGVNTNKTSTPTTGGVNSISCFVETGAGTNNAKYVLKIYNNGKNSARVKFEHQVLKHVSQLTLSFQIPRTIPSLKERKPHVLLSNGAEACVFHFIPGSLPQRTSSLKHIGRACGELNSALAKVKLESFDGSAPPYYELYKRHHAITRDQFFKAIKSSSFDSCREPISFLIQEILSLEKQLGKFRQKNLPRQLIHGDLHYNNVLVMDDDNVSGLLDFEFCAYDWRAMELATCLSKYADAEDPLPLFQSFSEGYLEHGRLTDNEIDIIADLINLRILSSVIFFVGRALAGEDGFECLTSRAQSLAKRVRWINKNRSEIARTIRDAI